MAEPQLADAPVAEATERRQTNYTVLKQEETEVAGANVKVWIAVAHSVQAENSQGAIKSVAIRDSEVLEGTYVAVPLTSFKPKTVKQVVQLSLGD